MYSTYNEGKSVVADRFIRTLKNKIYKYMPSISKNVYGDELDGIVNEYNNTYHRTTEMKPIDKGYTPNWSEEAFVTKKVRTTFMGLCY